MMCLNDNIDNDAKNLIQMIAQSSLHVQNSSVQKLNNNEFPCMPTIKYNNFNDVDNFIYPEYFKHNDGFFMIILYILDYSISIKNIIDARKKLDLFKSDLCNNLTNHHNLFKLYFGRKRKITPDILCNLINNQQTTYNVDVATYCFKLIAKYNCIIVYLDSQGKYKFDVIFVAPKLPCYLIEIKNDVCKLNTGFITPNNIDNLSSLTLCKPTLTKLNLLKIKLFG